jgi:hypothetical protein
MNTTFIKKRARPFDILERGTLDSGWEFPCSDKVLDPEADNVTFLLERLHLVLSRSH